MANVVFDVVTLKHIQFVYSDKGTHANTSVMVFQTDMDQLPEDCYIIGQVAVGFLGHEYNNAAPSSALFVLKVQGEADGLIRQPERFEYIWNDKKSGGHYDGSFWRVIPPAGYIALGDIVTNNYVQPSFQFQKKYACIREDLLWYGVFKETPLWTDKGSGAHANGSIWEVDGDGHGLGGFFKVNNTYDPPQVPIYGLPARVIKPSYEA